MARRCSLLIFLSIAIAAAPALAGDNYGQQKAAIDAKLAAVQAKVAFELVFGRGEAGWPAGTTSEMSGRFAPLR